MGAIAEGWGGYHLLTAQLGHVIEIELAKRR